MAEKKDPFYQTTAGQSLIAAIMGAVGGFGFADTQGDIKDSKQGILDQINSGFYKTEIARPNEVSFDSLLPQLVQAGQINAANVKQAKYNKINPLEFLQQIAGQNTDQYNTNFDLAKEKSTDLSQFEIDELNSYSPQAGELARSEVDLDNSYNQSRRIDNVNQASPYFNPKVNEGVDRSSTYAKGNFLTPEEDRAFEVFSRSVSADGTMARGFGDDSTAGRVASDLNSAERRFQISQYGESSQKEWIGMGFDANFDTPLKAKTSQDILGTPSLSPIQTQQGITNALTPLTSMDAATGLNSAINQNQFGTNLAQNVNNQNASYQQQANIGNVDNKLRADLSNQQYDYEAQLQKLSQDWNYSLSVANAEQAGYNQEAALKSELLAAQQFYDGLLLQNKITTFASFGQMLGQLAIGFGLADSASVTNNNNNPTSNG